MCVGVDMLVDGGDIDMVCLGGSVRVIVPAYMKAFMRRLRSFRDGHHSKSGQ
jgi:hypothetical protein